MEVSHNIVHLIKIPKMQIFNFYLTSRGLKVQVLAAALEISSEECCNFGKGAKSLLSNWLHAKWL